jgi:hypothetical protein
MRKPLYKPMNSRLQRSDDGVYLSAHLEFELPPSLEDALNRGMPLSFVVQADVMRERWYWSDKLVNRTERYMRLSFQPLSKRWRVYVSAQPIAKHGFGCESGAKLLTAWRKPCKASSVLPVGALQDASVMDLTTKQRLEFRFKLDLSQLPQPLQFGVSGVTAVQPWITRTASELQEDSFK